MRIEDALSLTNLEAFDRHASSHGTERRFCCPLPPCEGKPKDATHRSLTVNTDTGAWHCFRCGSKGLLVERWTRRPEGSSFDHRARVRKATERAFRLDAPTTEATPAPSIDPDAPTWKRRLSGLSARLAPPAAEYLASRGLPPENADDAGVRFAPRWEHWEKEKQSGRWAFKGRDRRVVFPLLDREGRLVGISARAIDTDFIEPKVITNGEKRLGVFATAGAWEAEVLTICEAPIDALSLAAVGLPAIALAGTTGPSWLPEAAAFRTVFLGLDNDGAGDDAAEKLSRALRPFGARCYRLRSVEKDWNADLQRFGVATMAAAIERGLSRIRTGAPSVPAAADEEPASDGAEPEDDASADDPLAAYLDAHPTAAQLLAALRSWGARVWLDGADRIGFDAAGALPPDHLAQLVERRRLPFLRLLRAETTSHP